MAAGAHGPGALVSRIRWVPGLALVLVAIGVALLHAARNRRGEPDATLELTERELSVRWGDEDNSGLSLNIVYELPDRTCTPAAPVKADSVCEWFDLTRLAAVGFDVSRSPDDSAAAVSYRKTLPRLAWAVLEYDGPAWAARLAREKAAADSARRAKARAMREDSNDREYEWDRYISDLRAGSRLFVVEVGRDPAALRARFPDRSRYFITRAKVDLDYVGADRDTTRRVIRPAYLYGSIRELRPGALQVPRQHRPVLDSIHAIPQPSRYDLPADSTPLPRYRVKVVYGKEHEPWVDGVGRLISP